ncbi:MAG: hypothetical protein IIA49_03325 [Bacteroidetes bacterium]|nr:hypothetical protein [Bacteroidota bacterium]
MMSKENNKIHIDSCVFKVGDNSYCVWENDLKKRNLSFLQSINPSFYIYNLDLHSKNLDGDNKHNAALSIRLLYHHSVETLFTLIFSALQAPKCVYAWFQKSNSKILRELVLKVTNRDQSVFDVIGLKNISWESISSKILLSDKKWTDNIDEISKSHSNFLHNLSNDYLSDYDIKEYNSIKHGLRLKQRGFKFAIGPQKELNQPAKPKDMKVIGESDFGSSFYSLNPIKNLDIKKYPHFQSRHYAINWNLDSLIKLVTLIAFSIENTISFLKIFNGEQEVNFKVPNDLEFYRMPWKDLSGVTQMNIDSDITKKMIKLTTKKEITDKLKQVSESRK